LTDDLFLKAVFCRAVRKYQDLVLLTTLFVEIQKFIDSGISQDGILFTADIYLAEQSRRFEKEINLMSSRFGFIESIIYIPVKGGV
jgi:hypothetical protein